MILTFADFARQTLAARRAGDAMLWLLAAIHMAVLISLALVLFSVSAARAQDKDVACTGKDLMAEMKVADPGGYANLVAEADHIPNGKGLLWKIEKDGRPASYLLGTMHVTDPRVVIMPPAARTAAAAASVIIVESDEILDEKKAAAALLMQPELSMFTDGTTITDHISNADAAKLDTGLKSRGLSLVAVSRMKPWMVASFVALPACEISRKAKGASFLDKKIAEDAVASGKKVVGLETMAEQLQAMAALPVSFHLQALIETLDLGDKMNDVMETMTMLYLSGDTGLTMPMLKAVTENTNTKDDAGYADFEKRIVTDRNKIMAERSADVLAQGNAFMAVGALHLPGEQGLVELLRARGFTVTAVSG